MQQPVRHDGTCAAPLTKAQSALTLCPPKPLPSTLALLTARTLQDGRTLLHVAAGHFGGWPDAMERAAEVVAQLVGLGADVNAKDVSCGGWGGGVKQAET